MILTERAARASIVAASLLTAACSPSADSAGAEQARRAAATPRAAAPSAASTATLPDAGASPVAAATAPSRIVSTADITLRGKPACDIRFAYAGRDTESLFWEEPCDAITARMLTREELTALGRWSRLDDYARRFVAALPGGRVLYVEGAASASVYPVGTGGSTYEVPVAD
ncbi:hypothetical protein [Sphingomonas sp. BK235]|jgi:hypothetical protein|uniref:hypothetical protein n=1 Tax=Sphingomonas sp. BK235 TaxID=2512131 RepID=UPI00105035DA|nr:hypothetical protein [Sphingomonas sp. BK235]